MRATTIVNTAQQKTAQSNTVQLVVASLCCCAVVCSCWVEAQPGSLALAGEGCCWRTTVLYDYNIVPRFFFFLLLSRGGTIDRITRKKSRQ